MNIVVTPYKQENKISVKLFLDSYDPKLKSKYRSKFIFNEILSLATNSNWTLNISRPINEPHIIEYILKYDIGDKDCSLEVQKGLEYINTTIKNSQDMAVFN